MRKTRFRTAVFLVLLLFTTLTIAIAVVTAQHIGHKCDSSFECHICRLLAQRELFALAVLLAALRLTFCFEKCLYASGGVCISLHFSSLVRLHVQMND